MKKKTREEFHIFVIFSAITDYESELNKKNQNKKWWFQYGRPKFKL